MDLVLRYKKTARKFADVELHAVKFLFLNTNITMPLYRFKLSLQTNMLYLRTFSLIFKINLLNIYTFKFLINMLGLGSLLLSEE